MTSEEGKDSQLSQVAIYEKPGELGYSEMGEIQSGEETDQEAFGPKVWTHVTGLSEGFRPEGGT